MKAILVVIMMGMLTAGCMTNGGFVAGPLSYMTAKMHEKSIKQRVISDFQMPAEKKPQVFRMIQQDAGDDRIAAVAQVDLVELWDAVANAKMTKGEYVSQAFTCAVDFLGEGYLLDKSGVVDDLKGMFKGDKDKDKLSGLPSVTGNGNTTIFNNGGTVKVDNSISGE